MVALARCDGGDVTTTADNEMQHVRLLVCLTGCGAFPSACNKCPRGFVHGKDQRIRHGISGNVWEPDRPFDISLGVKSAPWVSSHNGTSILNATVKGFNTIVRISMPAKGGGG